MTWATKLQERREKREQERERNLMALCKPAQVQRGSYGPAEIVARPKTQAKRNAALLEMAQLRPCLLRVPGVCQEDTATTVAAHSNCSIHGKAGARKADDMYSTWSCAACHRWLDTGTASYEEKKARFMLAHLEQVCEWRKIANDASEPERFRKAAAWALEMLNASGPFDAIEASGRAGL